MARQSKSDDNNLIETSAAEAPVDSGLAAVFPEMAAKVRRQRAARHPCVVCGKRFALRDMARLDVVRPNVLDKMRAEYPDLPGEGFVCVDDLDDYRAQYVSDLLHKERGELTKLEEDVVQSLADHETLAENTEKEFETQRTFGERLSDHLASFGGSWAFLIFFGVVLFAWMTFNVVETGAAQFDAYPFILLNLVLSCLAAIQAPIIMMSQKRQESKDRLRSENDYRVNLKAELEIRHLHEKIDHILTRQWERLAEIQQIQLELMRPVTSRRRR